MVITAEAKHFLVESGVVSTVDFNMNCSDAIPYYLLPFIYTFYRVVLDWDFGVSNSISLDPY